MDLLILLSALSLFPMWFSVHYPPLYIPTYILICSCIHPYSKEALQLSVLSRALIKLKHWGTLKAIFRSMHHISDAMLASF